MSEHTKGPWRIEPATKKDNWRIVGANGQVVSTFSGNMDMDNARRIVACVNACRGIRTEALEHRVHTLAAEDDTISLLMAQRDQLLAALEAIIELHDSARRGSDVAATIANARAAIAAVKGDHSDNTL